MSNITMGQGIIRIAKLYLGKGEEGANNEGFWCEVFRQEDLVRGRGDWCAEFASHCIINAYYGLGYEPPDVRSRGTRQLSRVLLRNGLADIVTKPKAGDIDIMSGHTAIHYRSRPGYWVNIEGNQGSCPAR